MLLACLGPTPLSGQSGGSGPETAATLKETLASAQTALAAGDYANAFRYFETLEETFGREPEVKEPSFRKVVLPLHAYAALRAGETETAVRRFERFIERFPDDRTRLPFVLFNLARAYQAGDDPDSAIETYRRFVALDPGRPEAALATLAAARLMFRADRPDEAFDALDALYERQPPGVIRTKARLTALQKALDLGRTESARHYMLTTRWSVTDMPELAVLAFSALEMGHALLDEGAYADAVRCYRLVPPYSALVEAQTRRLENTRQRFENRKSEVGLYQGGQFWTQFYQRLLGRLQHQLDALKEADDYTTQLYLSFGQAYLLDKRPHEAWLLFETLARDEALPPERQAEAHYRWILAAIDVGVWEDAFRIAEAFGEHFPESPLVPDARYLLANAYQEARRYRDAVETLDLFLRDHPDHRLAPRALFVRGYNHNLLNEPESAREDFDTFIQRHPGHGLFHDARFWRALTFFAERDYATTLEALGELAPDVRGGRLEPEVAYRRAATLYAKKDYEAALDAIRAYLDQYPRHKRHAEGRVLLGDIQMGRGNLGEARSIFASIGPEAGHLFTYAVFQTGKILRAVAGAEDRKAEQRAKFLRQHLEHFREYVRRDDIATKARLSDALYWIGWTHIERDEPDRARDVFARALDRYGNDVQAGQVLNIIDALARIEKRLTDLGPREREKALKQWIAEQKENALEAGRLTYFARLNFYLDSLFPPDEPHRIIFETVETVPIDRLDAEGLGRIAAALAERYPKVARDYLVKLEDEYPDSPHRTYGYYARAILLMQKGEYAEARTELARFRAESPMHPLSVKVALRYAETLTRTERYAKAKETLEELLRRRDAKGRPHAKALLALSRNAKAAGRLERAVPYAQRVYNVYRAYPELTAEAYWMSARQFEALGDRVAAYRTLAEMLADDRIADLPVAEKAAARRDALREALPEGALTENGEDADDPAAAVAETAESPEPTTEDAP